MSRALTAELGALRERFLARARSDVASVAELCRQVEQSPPGHADDVLAQLSMLLHRLAGTAGSFGLEALGLRARRLDRLCRMLQHDSDADYGNRLTALVEGVQDMGRDIDSSGSSTDTPGVGTHLASVPTLPEAVVVPAPAPAEVDASFVQATPPEAAPAVELAPLVCVVAESSAFRARLRQALEGFGYRVVEFASLVELEEDASEAVTDAIVARVDPHELAGSALRRIRARRPDPVPLVLVSPRAGFDDFLAGVRGGADGYAVEPVDLTRLEARLHYLISRRSRDGLRVLLVDDDTDLLAACTLILESANMEVATVDRPSAVLEELVRFRPEVIVVDIRMPQCTGPELAQVIRMNEEWLHVPIVYMSSQADGSDQLLATGKAGEAFLAKPIDARELVATVSANGRHARQMVETASKDTLTGLLKHSFIKEHLAAELERAHRQGHATCAAMVDIDHFKDVNDRHGHPAGDLVIRTLASLLRQRLRAVDGIGRMGGEEFLAVLSNCGAAEAASILDGIRRRFAQIEFAGQGGVFHVSFSAGIAESRGSTHGAGDVLASADRALYRAKAQGRNRVLLSHL
jgi:diguanylate cyclase (GGDEF)-like protein